MLNKRYLKLNKALLGISICFSISILLLITIIILLFGKVFEHNSLSGALSYGLILILVMYVFIGIVSCFLIANFILSIIIGAYLLNISFDKKIITNIIFTGSVFPFVGIAGSIMLSKSENDKFKEEY